MSTKRITVPATTTQTAAEEPRTLLTVSEAADRLALPRSALYTLLQRRALISVKIGRLRRVPVWALEAFVRRLVTEQEVAMDGPVGPEFVNALGVPEEKGQR